MTSFSPVMATIGAITTESRDVHGGHIVARIFKNLDDMDLFLLCTDR